MTMKTAEFEPAAQRSPVRVTRRGSTSVALIVLSVLSSLSLFSLMALLAPAARAQQWNFIGSRQQAMGGTGVAITDDSTAQYWNPASFGFKKKGEWDAQLPITVNASIENKLLESVSDLAFRYDDVQGVFDSLQNGGGTPPTVTEINDTVEWLVDLNAIGDTPESVHGQAGIGLLGHVGRLGFGVVSNTMITTYTDIDLANIGFDEVAFATFLGQVTATHPGVEDGLKTQIAGLPQAFWTPTRADALVDSFIDSPNVDAADPAVQKLILDIATSVGNNSFAANTSGVVAAGLSLQEFGISYGYALPMPFFKPLDRKFSVGATAKYILGIAFARSALYTDGVDGIGLGGLEAIQDPTISHNFGLDLGVDFRPYSFVRFGLTARNVNAPKFSAGSFGDLRVRPEVRLGTSITPIENLVLAFDVDLTENRMETIGWDALEPRFRSRIVSLGSEYTIPLGKPSALALRFGAYSNISDEVNNNWALTGGLGLKVWSFVLDLSIGASLKRDEVRTGEFTYVNVPDHLNAGLGLKWVKSL